MKNLIIVTLLLTAQYCFCQTGQTVTVPLSDVQSCIEAFDELDSLRYFSDLRDSAIAGLEVAISERDLLLNQKDADFGLLMSSKGYCLQQLRLSDERFKLSEKNFKLLRTKKNKQLIGGTVGSFLLGVGVMALAMAFK